MTSQKRLFAWLILLPLTLVGLLITGVAVGGLIYTRNEFNLGARTEGEVVKIITRRSSRQEMPRRHPVVEFEAQDGKTYRFEERVSGSHDQGETVTVVYDPDDPKTARIFSFWTRWLGFLALAFGLAILGTGILTLTLVLRQARREEAAKPG